jgi:hypothetical protein
VANIYQAELARLRFLQESAYGVDGSGTLVNYDDIPGIIRTIKPKRAETMVQPGHVIQRLDQRSIGVPMPRNETEFAFDTNLETFTTKAGSAVAATQHWLGKMLECGLGGKQLSTGTTISGTGSTTTVVNVTSAASFRAGGALAIVNASTGKLEIRVIKSIATNAITLKMALGAAPTTAGVTVYGAATYFLHNHPNGAEPIYGQFLYEGYNPYDRYMLPGGAFKSFGFSGLEPAGIPRINWVWQHPTWLPADGTNTVANLRAVDLGRATYTNINLSTVRDADCRLRPLSSSALPAFLHATKVDVAPNIVYDALRTPGGGLLGSTVSGYRRKEVYEEPVVRVSLEVHQENNSTLDDYHANATELAFTEQIGSTAAKGGVLIEVGRMQIMEPPDWVDIGAVKGKSVVLQALDDTDATPAGGATALETALTQASLRIIFV